MRIYRSKRFEDELDEIFNFIARDSVHQALKFVLEVSEAVGTLDFWPRKCRKSIHFDDPNIRDFIFKGYVMPYKIDDENDEITVLGIYKHNIWNP